MLRRIARQMCAAALLFSLALLAPAFAASNALDAGMPAFPALTGPVVDTAHLLPAGVFSKLSQKLAAYASDTGTQLVVVTVPTLNGYPIEYYGYQLGRHWGIGQKGKNNGALLIVDAGERKLRIEVGYGLDGTLTDAASFEIIHDIIAPRFKQRDYARGIVAGTDAILTALGDRSAAAAQPRQLREQSTTGGLMLLVVVLVLMPLLARMFAGRGGGSGLLWLGLLAMLGGSGGGGFGGGGFGGGGFGGFSGGGGSFGGGGASGGW